MSISFEARDALLFEYLERLLVPFKIALQHLAIKQEVLEDNQLWNDFKSI